MLGLPKLPNELRWKHWAIVRKHDGEWHWAVYGAVARDLKPVAPLKRALVTLTRHSARQPDPDGNVGSWKPVLDGLVKIGVLEDDSAEHVTLDCRWEKAAPRRGKITIVVVEKS